MRWLFAFALFLAACEQNCKSGGSQSACCKVCTTGKPCGDTCIPATDTCHQAPGCACKSGTQSACCTVCTNGKPCGDTCISATDTCHQAPGCACAR